LGLHQVRRTKGSHKLRALGNVEAVIADSPSLSEAARRLGVNRSTVHRWIAAGKVPRPGEALPPENVMAGPAPAHLTSAGADGSNGGELAGFDVADLLTGCGRPGQSDPDGDQKWLAARRRVLVVADQAFDPRQVLTMSASAAAEWVETRIAYMRVQVGR
jgi:hypothetical protein